VKIDVGNMAARGDMSGIRSSSLQFRAASEPTTMGRIVYTVVSSIELLFET
jgi:hypothetical protein